MKPSNPKYTPEQVGLIEPNPNDRGWFDYLFVPLLPEFAENERDYRQHYIFALLNPEE